jgi:hypothetical protein
MNNDRLIIFLSGIDNLEFSEVGLKNLCKRFNVPMAELERTIQSIKLARTEAQKTNY